MITPTRAHEDRIPSDQGGIDASRDLPILLCPFRRFRTIRLHHGFLLFLVSLMQMVGRVIL